MRQEIITYKDNESLKSDLQVFHNSKSSKILFNITSTILNEDLLKSIFNLIQTEFPDALINLCTTAGNVVQCEYLAGIHISVTEFEYNSTKIDIEQYDFTKLSKLAATRKISQYIDNNPWVKAIELYYTVGAGNSSDICDGMEELSKKIMIFGGLAGSEDISSPASYVYSSKGSLIHDGMTVIYYGGEDLHIGGTKVTGWKQIGKAFKITKSRGNVLYEVDNLPAFGLYRKYLNIKNDDSFFANALEFPIVCDYKGVTILRAAGCGNPDDSITLSGNVTQGTSIRLSYGDPETIINSIKQVGHTLQHETPDVLHVFSCAARKAFWDGHHSISELSPFDGMCSITGFLSHGEFINEQGLLNQHNITLVIVYFREGSVKQIKSINNIHISDKIPLVARMSTFIGQMTYDLEQTNAKLEAINSQLKNIAVIDSLTGLGNRYQFDDCIEKAAAGDPKNKHLIIFDVNGLKFVNDTLGHNEGDVLIKSASEVISDTYGKYGKCFRIGGDEFAVIITASEELMESLRLVFKNLIQRNNENAVYSLSIAYGHSTLLDPLGNTKTISDWKMDADLNMYKDKALFHTERAGITGNPEFDELISCIIALEDAKDSYTANHSKRVQKIAIAISEKLALSEKTINIISSAAYLHDIGKVGINDSILSKPGKLTAEEFKSISKHPSIGAKILMQSHYTHELVDIVMHHHEKFNGSGYPDGLSGTEIPIGARVIAIADSIDAMLSKRVYRDSLTIEQCYKEIEKNLGIMYDPAIGRVVLKHFDEIIKNINSFKLDIGL